MSDDNNVTFICDPLLSEHGPIRPAMLIARKLQKKGKSITMVSTTISTKMQEKFNAIEIQTVDLRKEPFFKKNESISWLEEWIREAAFSMNSRGADRLNGMILNFSNTICLPSHVWYAQGPPTITLDNMREHLPILYKLIYVSLAPIFKICDKALNRKTANCSARVVSNSKYLASVYNQLGVPINSVIYPPLDCGQFKPTTAKPSEDFILTYFGKETIFGPIKQILDVGIEVKAFGGKLSMIPKEILKHPNLDFLGKIEDKKLIDLYSNAFLTFYPFIDEPFGYIPIESMACGTPVLTYNRQGPKETITNGKTGWLANDNLALVKLAFQIWRTGYPKNFRRDCRREAMKFDIDKIMQNWTLLLNSVYT